MEQVYAVETFHQIIGDIRPLLSRHWEEIANYKEDIPLEPDFDLYAAMSDAGLIRFISVRLDGNLIGYAIYFVKKRNLHYNASWAVSDIIWIAPEHRNAGVGNGLFDFTENYLRSQGVKVMQTMTKTGHPALAFLLKSRGHGIAEEIYAKVL